MDYELPLKDALDRAWAVHLATHSAVTRRTRVEYSLDDTSMENGTPVKPIQKN